MKKRNLKTSSSKRTAELFVRVEDRINTRKAMEKETACTFRTLADKLPKTVRDGKK